MSTTTASFTTSLSAGIRNRARALGFDPVGIAPARESDHGAFYRRWLAEGRHGEMAYLARDDAVARRLDPRSAWPWLRSAVVVGHNYYSEGEGKGEGGGEGPAAARIAAGARTSAPAALGDPSRGIIARYARGRDYHRVVRKKLLALLRWIEDEVGRALPAARAYVDTGPVLERELARRAGLGWFGRNTMLIHPRRGSYFFLGALLLDIELEYDAPFEEDRCGTCAACVEACPTGALLGRDADGAPVIDATRCISYLTIENRGPIPRALRPAIGNRIYGCDICQEVCPWNGPKFVQITSERDYTHYAASPFRSSGGRAAAASASEDVSDGAGGADHTAPSLLALLRMDEDEWDAFSRGRPIRRAKRAGVLRNVAVAVGNWGAPEAVPSLVEALDDPEPLVRGHAAWALGRIGTAEAREALKARLGVEENGWVRGEIAAAASERSSVS